MGVQKAIAAFLGTVIPFAANFIPGLSDMFTPEFTGGLSIVLATFFVWFFPNKAT